MTLPSKLILGLMSCIVVLAGCGDDPGSTEQTGDATGLRINATDFTFSPSSIAAEPGAETTVVLTNGDSTDHSFTIDELDVDLVVGGDEEGTVTFTAPDSDVAFHCRFHSNMTGMLTTGTPSGGGETQGGTDAGDSDPGYDY